jgi:hypothetical protein
MDTNMDREELMGGADGLQTLIIDIEDLVDWASESTSPPDPQYWDPWRSDGDRGARIARGPPITRS